MNKLLDLPRSRHVSHGFSGSSNCGHTCRTLQIIVPPESAINRDVPAFCGEFVEASGRCAWGMKRDRVNHLNGPQAASADAAATILYVYAPLTHPRLQQDDSTSRGRLRFQASPE